MNIIDNIKKERQCLKSFNAGDVVLIGEREYYSLIVTSVVDEDDDVVITVDSADVSTGCTGNQK